MKLIECVHLGRIMMIFISTSYSMTSANFSSTNEEESKKSLLEKYSL
jgi:hypothetical protein